MLCSSRLRSRSAREAFGIVASHGLMRCAALQSPRTTSVSSAPHGGSGAEASDPRLAHARGCRTPAASGHRAWKHDLAPAVRIVLKFDLEDAVDRDRARLISWPRPVFPRGRRKLTLAGRTIAPKVSFLAPLRPHTGGHALTVTTGQSPAGHSAASGRRVAFRLRTRTKQSSRQPTSTA
jgi:hypothetical protein